LRRQGLQAEAFEHAREVLALLGLTAGLDHGQDVPLREGRICPVEIVPGRRVVFVELEDLLHGLDTGRMVAGLVAGDPRLQAGRGQGGVDLGLGLDPVLPGVGAPGILFEDGVCQPDGLFVVLALIALPELVQIPGGDGRLDGRGRRGGGRHLRRSLIHANAWGPAAGLPWPQEDDPDGKSRQGERPERGDEDFLPGPGRLAQGLPSQLVVLGGRLKVLGVLEIADELPARLIPVFGFLGQGPVKDVLIAGGRSWLASVSDGGSSWTIL